MAFDFFPGTPYGAYQGTIASRAFQRSGAKGDMILMQVDWSKYAIGGEVLGTANPNFAVVVSYKANANVPEPFIVKSIYIDNSNSITPIYAFFADTLYTVEVEAGAIGWFPVISNSPQLYIIAIGLVSGFLPITNVGVTNIEIPPYTNIANPQSIELNLASPVIGGGAPLSSITVVNEGAWYNNGNVNISGGGGSAALASGNLDQFGRFVSVTINNFGSGFVGFPTITATGGQTPPAPWVPGQTTQPGTLRTDNSGGGGIVYQCTQAFFGGSPIANINPSNASTVWASLGILGNPALTASFQANLGVSGTAIITDGYGTPALGDQSNSNIVSVTGTGVVFDNLFGSPFSSGFIYLTHVNFTAYGNGQVECSLQSSDGAIVQLEFFTDNSPGLISSIQKANIKMDAKKQWQLKCNSHAADQLIMFSYVWTYALQ